MNLLLSLFSVILASRLLYLPFLEETENQNNKDGTGIINKRYLMNDRTNLKLELATMQNITKMYVEIHDRSIYFYRRGIYFTFAFSDNGIALKLTQSKIPERIEYFTEGKPSEKIMRWKSIDSFDNKKNQDDNRPRLSTNSNPKSINSSPGNRRDFNYSISRIKKGNEDNAKRSYEKDKADFSQNKKQKIDNEIEKNNRKLDEEIDTYALEKKKDARLQREESMSTSLIDKLSKLISNIKPEQKNTEESLKSAKPQEKRKKKIKNEDIPSDSEIFDNNSLKLSIETLNSINKTFRLKAQENTCLTYFKETFILSNCSSSKNQIFSVQNANDVISELKKSKINKNPDFQIKKFKIIKKDKHSGNLLKVKKKMDLRNYSSSNFETEVSTSHEMIIESSPSKYVKKKKSKKIISKTKKPVKSNKNPNIKKDKNFFLQKGTSRKKRSVLSSNSKANGLNFEKKDFLSGNRDFDNLFNGDIFGFPFTDHSNEMNNKLPSLFKKDNIYSENSKLGESQLLSTPKTGFLSDSILNKVNSTESNSTLNLNKKSSKLEKDKESNKTPANADKSLKFDLLNKFSLQKPAFSVGNDQKANGLFPKQSVSSYYNQNMQFGNQNYSHNNNFNTTPMAGYVSSMNGIPNQSYNSSILNQGASKASNFGLNSNNKELVKYQEYNNYR